MGFLVLVFLVLVFLVWYFLHHPCMATLTHELLPPRRGGSLLMHQILPVLATLARSLQLNKEHDLTDKNMYIKYTGTTSHGW